MTPAARRLDLRQIADEIASSVDARWDDPRLRWSDVPAKVKVNVAKTLRDEEERQRNPSRSKATRQGRSKKLSEEIRSRLEASGWRHLGQNAYARES